MELQNLKELAEKLRKDFAGNFDSSDRELPRLFKDKVKKINTFNLKYNRYSVIFKGEKGALDSYIPNQQIYIAAYYNEYTQELFKYKKEVERIIRENNIGTDFKTFFTNERNAQSTDESEFHKMLETQNISSNNKELLYKFVTDYEWWGGGKTIDRPDFFHSAILSVIGVTAAANVTMAYICGHLAENDELIDLLNNHNQLASKVSNSSNQNLALNQDGYDHIIIDISYEDIECENEKELVDILSKDIELQNRFTVKSTLANFAYLKYHKLFKKIGCNSKATAEPILKEANLYTSSSGSGSGISPIINLIEALESGNCCGVNYYDTADCDVTNTTSAAKNPLQIIYFGSPGTGKSYGIKDILHEHNIDEERRIGLNRLYRTTFHPDSDYSSFVGCYKPISKRKNNKPINLEELKQEYINSYIGVYETTTKGIANFIKDYVESIIIESKNSSINKVLQYITGTDNPTYFVEMVHLVNEERERNSSNISYEFIPQVFTEAYIAAWEREAKGESVFLVIEEINRGNCAQIFGDLFQLLDRNTKGYSEYKIKAESELRSHLERRLGKGTPGIKNGELTLPANLHILATMNTSDQSLFPMDSAFKRRWAWKYVPINENCEDSQFKINIGDIEYPWREFIVKVNDRIRDLTESEDKQIGNFFIKNDIDEDEFKSKVMFYLWSEVCKEYYKVGSFFKYRDDEGDSDKEFTFSQLFADNDIDILHGFMKHLEIKGTTRSNN